MARIGLGASVGGSFVSRLPHLRSRPSMRHVIGRQTQNGVGLAIATRSYGHVDKLLHVFREAAPTSVNVTVGRRSREYLTEREVERLIEAAATIVLVAPQAATGDNLQHRHSGWRGRASLRSVFDPLQLQRDLQSCGQVHHISSRGCSASFFRTYRQVGLFRV
jgi:hypothetical protein